MRFPSRNDTIVAVSTAWQASAVGVVRLSGPQSVALAEQVVATPDPWPAVSPASRSARLRLDECGEWPAHLLAFRAPRSYTGQDVVEIHTVGALPLLRSLCDRLIQLGARRALPGEFSARAYLNGRMQRQQVDGVLLLLRAGDDATLRLAARQARGTSQAQVATLVNDILELLAAIEAGVDFVDEEDIRFISPAQFLARVDALLAIIGRRDRAQAGLLRASRPHVALVGLPNAGKSALFNRLVGCERAIVSPVLGTTRDVLSCELTLHDRTIVLQDCAGLGPTSNDLDLAAHCAAERTAEQADLVLWLHAIDAVWTSGERAACERIESSRRILVLSKSDLRAAPIAQPPPSFRAHISLSALTGDGVDNLRTLIAEHVVRTQAECVDGAMDDNLGLASAALRRARELVDLADESIAAPELIAFELRTAGELLRGAHDPTVDEAVLGRIFSQFCIGK